MEETISNFTPSDWIAVIAIIASVVSTLGGIFLTHHFTIKNERRRAKEEFIDKEISPLIVYCQKLSGLDKLLREETTDDVLDEKLEAIHFAYIESFLKLKDHLDKFITEGKISYLVGKKGKNQEILLKLVQLHAMFEFYNKETPFIISRKPLELNLPTKITYKEYESVMDLLVNIEEKI